MKKIWLLITLLVAGLLLSWCFEKVQDCIWWEAACTKEIEVIDDCVTIDWEDSCVADIEEPVVEESNIPTFEELNDVVATCHIDDMGWYDEDVLKNQFILPYKDWYIGYGFGWNWWTWWYLLTYKSLDNPCEIIAKTDEFFIWHADYPYEVKEYNNVEYPDNKLYVAQWWWSGIPIDTVAKDLNCEAWNYWMDNDACKKEVERYMYNLILWNEENEVFTKWMNRFKNDIDNDTYTNRILRSDNRKICNSKNSWESLMEEYWEDNRNLSEEKRREYQKIRHNRIHECIENLIRY